MLLIREVVRLVANVIRSSIGNRTVILLVAVLLAAAIALLSTTITVIGPVAIYPFL